MVHQNGLAGAAIVVALFLSACAGPSMRAPSLDPEAVALEERKQQELAMREYVRQLSRLHRVGRPILEAGVPLCKERTTWTVGVLFATKDEFPEERRGAARTLYQVDENLRVFLVTENSPAAKAGLQAGDQILSIDGVTPPKGGQISRTFSDALRKKMKDGSPVPIVFRRGTTDSTVTATPTRICDYGLSLVEDDTLNAFADGDSIHIFTGMMRFTETDTELALVVGHELAHNAMRHIEAQRTNVLGGLLLDILAAAVGINTQGAFAHMASRVYSKEFEAEADYIGLYAVALTGQGLASAPDFWRKMAAAHPGSIKQDYAATHPGTPERFLHLEQVVKEIDDKRARNVALLRDLTKTPSSQKQEQPEGTGFSPK